MEFSYEAYDRYVHLNNTDRNISASQFGEGFELMPTERVADLSALQGYAYLWGILMDSRIRQGLY
ncbi:hypothetical protein D3C87_1994420 [compost metagenome]